MKKVFTFFLCVIICLDSISAQSKSVSFKFDIHSVSNSATRIMESNLSLLLSAINVASINNTDISFGSISIEGSAKVNLQNLWKNMHFYCEDKTYVCPCLEDAQGYQVRGIAITLQPLSGYNGTTERELTVSFSRSGMITGVRLALEQNQIDPKHFDTSVTDARERLEILKFVEDFRGYYVEKNIEALERVYADDALIISGSVIRTENHGDMVVNKVKYRKEDKTQYIDRMRRMFNAKKYLDVGFDHISIERHGAKPFLYGVTLHQDWKSVGYSGGVYEDSGWLFLLWDFQDPNNPVIHVRTWQPNEIAKQEGVFDFNDFWIP